MKKHQLLLFIVLTVALVYIWLQTTEGFVGSAAELLPDKDIQEGQARYNDLMKLINIANPAVPLDAKSEQDFNAAFGPEVKVKLPDGIPARLSTAANVCEKVKTPDCSAFNSTDFSANCGISFDPKGTNSAGQPHMGGLYIDPSTRGAKKPTFGTADPTKFVTDASSCQVMSETIACQTKQTFSSPNCAQCLTTSVFNRIDPVTPRLTPTLNLQGSGTLGDMVQLSSQTQQIQMNGIVEGNTYTLAVTGDPTTCYIAGYISCQTVAGLYRLDIAALIDLDISTGYKPRQGGYQPVDGMQCAILRPANGSGSMNLRGNLPFTFVSVSEADAAGCDNGPYITQAASANFLASDVCYSGNGTAPSLACLQQKFIQIGGTQQGTGYPTSEAAAATLLQTIGASDLPTISTYLYNMAIKASTGRDTNGNQLALADWNTASVFMTGTQITNPCSATTTPLSQQCLQYLYQNGGAGSSIGPTYTLGQQYASGTPNAPYCKPGAGLDPTTPTGLSRGQAAGSITAAKTLYDQTHRLANDNTADPTSRATAIADCYGVQLDTLPTAQISNTVSCAPWTVTNGGYYDSTSGNQSCFSGQTLQTTQAACCANSQCVGFSFNNPTGAGCYKLDTKAGFYATPSYQGYFKAGSI
jgi:hypothetical protein